MYRIRTMVTLTVAAALAGTSGCSAVDRAGGTADEPVRALTFAQANDGEPPPQLRAWADEVERASDGSLSIEFANGWRGGEAGAERGIIDDVAKGEADLGWVGARAFDRVGVTSFQALLAPMLVDSHALQRAVFEEGIPEEMLAGVDDAGVVGIGVLPGPMRKVLGLEKPFREPGDFRGAVIGMQDSALTQAAMEAQGATATAEPSGATLDGLDAYEQQLASIAGNGYVAQARYVTGNLNLWPRPLVLFANPDTIDDLGDLQQDALRLASRNAVLPALEASSTEDGEGADELCVQGMELVEASDDELGALRKAWEPLYGDLAADPDTARWLDRIEQLKESLGAEPDTATCTGDGSGVQAGVLPDGTYRTTVTLDEVRSTCPAGARGAENLAGFATDQVAEITVDGESVRMTVYPVGHPEQREHGWTGTYTAFRDTLQLMEVGTADDPLSSTYTFDGKWLTLADMQTEFCDHQVMWTGHPWELIEPEAASAPPSDNQPPDDLTGVWTTELTAADWAAAGFEGTAGTWTLEFADGRVTGTQPDGVVGYRASYSTFRGRLVTSEAEDVLNAAYRVEGDRLYLTDVTVPGVDDGGPYVVVWATHPYTRAG